MSRLKPRKDIVTAARADAERAAEIGEEDIRKSVPRRLQTPTEQIDAAEKAAIRQIKDRAVTWRWLRRGT